MPTKVLRSGGIPRYTPSSCRGSHEVPRRVVQDAPNTIIIMRPPVQHAVRNNDSGYPHFARRWREERCGGYNGTSLKHHTKELSSQNNWQRASLGTNPPPAAADPPGLARSPSFSSEDGEITEVSMNSNIQTPASQSNRISPCVTVNGCSRSDSSKCVGEEHTSENCLNNASEGRSKELLKGFDATPSKRRNSSSFFGGAPPDTGTNDGCCSENAMTCIKGSERSSENLSKDQLGAEIKSKACTSVHADTASTPAPLDFTGSAKKLAGAPSSAPKSERNDPRHSFNRVQLGISPRRSPHRINSDFADSIFETPESRHPHRHPGSDRACADCYRPSTHCSARQFPIGSDRWHFRRTAVSSEDSGTYPFDKQYSVKGIRHEAHLWQQQSSERSSPDSSFHGSRQKFAYSGDSFSRPTSEEEYLYRSNRGKLFSRFSKYAPVPEHRRKRSFEQSRDFYVPPGHSAPFPVRSSFTSEFRDRTFPCEKAAVCAPLRKRFRPEDRTLAVENLEGSARNFDVATNSQTAENSKAATSNFEERLVSECRQPESADWGSSHFAVYSESPCAPRNRSRQSESDDIGIVRKPKSFWTKPSKESGPSTRRSRSSSTERGFSSLKSPTCSSSEALNTSNDFTSQSAPSSEEFPLGFSDIPGAASRKPRRHKSKSDCQESVFDNPENCFKRNRSDTDSRENISEPCPPPGAVIGKPNRNNVEKSAGETLVLNLPSRERYRDPAQLDNMSSEKEDDKNSSERDEGNLEGKRGKEVLKESEILSLPSTNTNDNEPSSPSLSFSARMITDDFLSTFSIPKKRSTVAAAENRKDDNIFIGNGSAQRMQHRKRLKVDNGAENGRSDHSPISLNLIADSSPGDYRNKARKNKKTFWSEDGNLQPSSGEDSQRSHTASLNSGRRRERGEVKDWKPISHRSDDSNERFRSQKTSLHRSRSEKHISSKLRSDDIRSKTGKLRNATQIAKLKPRPKHRIIESDEEGNGLAAETTTTPRPKKSPRSVTAKSSPDSSPSAIAMSSGDVGSSDMPTGQVKDEYQRMDLVEDGSSRKEESTTEGFSLEPVSLVDKPEDKPEDKLEDKPEDKPEDKLEDKLEDKSEKESSDLKEETVIIKERTTSDACDISVNMSFLASSSTPALDSLSSFALAASTVASSSIAGSPDAAITPNAAVSPVIAASTETVVDSTDAVAASTETTPSQEVSKTVSKPRSPPYSRELCHLYENLIEMGAGEAFVRAKRQPPRRVVTAVWRDNVKRRGSRDHTTTKQSAVKKKAGSVQSKDDDDGPPRRSSRTLPKGVAVALSDSSAVSDSISQSSEETRSPTRSTDKLSKVPKLSKKVSAGRMHSPTIVMLAREKDDTKNTSLVSNKLLSSRRTRKTTKKLNSRSASGAGLASSASAKAKVAAKAAEDALATPQRDGAKQKANVHAANESGKGSGNSVGSQVKKASSAGAAVARKKPDASMHMLESLVQKLFAHIGETPASITQKARRDPGARKAKPSSDELQKSASIVNGSDQLIPASLLRLQHCILNDADFVQRRMYCFSGQ